MFQSARLKLTTWYLCIIMLISIVFSVALYNLSTREIQRIIRRVEFVRQQEHEISLQLPLNLPNVTDLEESEQRLALTLVLINGIILIISGGAGYFLAGKTLRPIQKMVDEQNRFITDASHELRTPLTALRSEIEVNLRDENLTLDNAKNLLASNLEEVESLQDLSDNLLQLAQFQKPNGTIPFDKIDLSGVIDDAIKKVNPLAKKKSIQIKKLGNNYSVKGDKQSLTQLLVILLDNAIKYSNQKKVITVRTKSPDHSALIEITDQGIGIDKKDLDHIFDRFYRADTSRSKQKSAGYGLGLSIAKKIVDAHKGYIGVKSDRDKGTTFTIQLAKI